MDSTNKYVKWGIIIVIILLVVWLFSDNHEHFDNFPLRQYKVTFKSGWGDSSVPISYPPDPHTGTMFLAVHNASYAPFELNGYATPGVQRSAEFGMSDLIAKEATQGPNARNVFKTYTGPVLMTPGQKDFIIQSNNDNHYLSFVTMIAPSSNWFTGASGIDLNTVPYGIDIPLYAYDAGTDTGKEFKVLPKQPRIPHVPISQIQNGLLFPMNNGSTIPFGYLNITPM